MKHTPIVVAIAGLLLAGSAFSSSHREAPAITLTPKVDGTDLYMFRSYESGRSGYVTFLANYLPLQDPTGGPNFFQLDPAAVYSIKIDTNGDAVPDIEYDFRFQNTTKNLAINVGGQQILVPLVNIGPFSTTPTGNDNNKNVIETYTVSSRAGSQMSQGTDTPATNLTAGGTTFRKPFDNIGQKSIPNYAAYADSHIYRIGLAGCGEGRVFVGQRKEGFAVAVGRIFDLFNLNPLGSTNAYANDLAQKNVTTIALEVPISCLTNNGSPIIGAWTTASLPQFPNAGGSSAPIFMRQASRLSAPLVNEAFIGLPDKDKFNASQPKDDAQFLKYVQYPTLPALIQTLFPDAKAPTKFPRTDLVAAFLTGIKGLNQPANVTPSEMMRLNTSLAVKSAATQNNLGVIGGDTAGFPNGRRPGDDVVDIELRVAMGVLLSAADAPSGQLPFTDGVTVKATDFRETFPYLNTPLPGATNAGANVAK